MTHDDMIHQVFQFRDGELPLSRRAAVTEHLAACRACRDRLDTWDRTAKRFFPTLENAGSDAFVLRVMQRLAQEPLHNRSRGRGWKSFADSIPHLFTWPRLALAGVAAAGALTFWIRTPHQTPGDTIASLQYAMTLVQNTSEPTEEPGAYGTQIEEYFL